MNPIKINLNDSVTSRLTFEPYEAYNNLCLGYLTSVSVQESESAADAKWAFAGMSTPRLVFEFVQLKDQYNTKDRYFIHSELPISNTDKTGAVREDKDITSDYIEMWRRIKHIHDAYVSSPNYTPITEEPEFDPSLPEGELLAAFKVFFTKMAEAFNTGKDGKTPIFEPSGTAKKLNLVALKLVAGGMNSARLVFPKYINKGIIEPAVFSNSKLDVSLKFRPNETVVLGQTTMARGANPSAVNNELTDEIKNILGQ